MQLAKFTGAARRGGSVRAPALALAAVLGSAGPGHAVSGTVSIECGFGPDSSGGMLNFGLMHDRDDEWTRSARDAPTRARQLSGTFADGAHLPSGAPLPEEGEPLVFSLHDEHVHVGLLSLYPGGRFVQTMHTSYGPGDAEARSGTGECWMVTF